MPATTRKRIEVGSQSIGQRSPYRRQEDAQLAHRTKTNLVLEDRSRIRVCTLIDQFESAVAQLVQSLNQRITVSELARDVSRTRGGLESVEANAIVPFYVDLQVMRRAELPYECVQGDAFDIDGMAAATVPSAQFTIKG